MIWSDWKNSYDKIVEELELNAEADEKTSVLLDDFFCSISTKKKNTIHQKLSHIFQHPVIIAGAGPSLKQDLTAILESKNIHNLPLISVNGATTLFKQKKIVPLVVVSDLDGDLIAIKWAIEKGALTLLHGHGDNGTIIFNFLEQHHDILSNYDVWGTTQCKPKHSLFNFGGFTDGDRAIFIAFHFQSPLIGLIGFDFGVKIGQYSVLNSSIKKNGQFKLKKFKIALALLEKFHSRHRGTRYNLTTQGEVVPGFPNRDIPSFLSELAEYYK